MRKAKVVYLDGDQQREFFIPPELISDSKKKHKFIEDRIGNVDYVELFLFKSLTIFFQTSFWHKACLLQAPLHQKRRQSFFGLRWQYSVIRRLGANLYLGRQAR